MDVFRAARDNVLGGQEANVDVIVVDVVAPQNILQLLKCTSFFKAVLVGCSGIADKHVFEWFHSWGGRLAV